MNYKRQNYKLKKILRDLIDGKLHLELLEQRNFIERAIRSKKKITFKTDLIKRKTGKVLGFKKDEIISPRTYFYD